jgi:uncharacterized cupredoxin-like copper-binding protein
MVTFCQLTIIFSASILSDMKNLGLLLVSGFLLAGCFHQAWQTEEAVPVVEENGMMPAEDGMMGEGKEMMVEGEDEVVDYVLDLASFTFTPNVLMAEPGQTLKVKLTNVQGFHDFVIDELNVASKQLQEGESVVVEIEVPMSAAGQSYEFYCSVGNHRAQGMVGTLEVSEE